MSSNLKPIKPGARGAIQRCFGLLKRKSDDKTFAEEMAEYKREEKELEGAKLERMTRAGLLPIRKASKKSKSAG